MCMRIKLAAMGVSPGIAIGTALVLSNTESAVNKSYIKNQEKAAEFSRFIAALKTSGAQIAAILKSSKAALGEETAGIFAAQSDMLNDPEFISSVKRRIFEELMNAECALSETASEIIALFDNISDEYLRARASDVRDVMGRIAQNLNGSERLDLSKLSDDTIIIAEDLLPSDTAAMDFKKVLGFATDNGGQTSHTSIIARTLGIPAVVGLKEAVKSAANGDTVLLDGAEGVIIINPCESEISDYLHKRAAYMNEQLELTKLKELAAETVDKRRIELYANIGGHEDCGFADENGAEGIGLFRTELLFMNSKAGFPTEDAQFAVYKAASKEMNGKPIIIRTLDIGGDKELPYYNRGKEANPFLGHRAIRICLENAEIFKPQLRAILRAGVFGKLKIMFPMITSVEEFTKAVNMLNECKDELKSERIAYDDKIETGIMIETPASIILAERFAKIADFFSIGTNDLTQYILAADRGNEKVARLYSPFHPAVLAAVKRVIDISHEHGIRAGICGEFAGDERAALLLIGMGADELSMNAAAIPRIKKLIRSAKYTDAKKIAEESMTKATTDEVMESLANWELPLFN